MSDAAEQLIEPERESRGFHLRDSIVIAVRRARLIRALDARLLVATRFIIKA
jgi:hypothetical protein